MKKIIQILCSLFLVFGLSGCGKTYEDTNGENNTSLNTITNENIEKMDIGASGLGYSEIDIAGITSREYSSKNFNGVEEIEIAGIVYANRVEVCVDYINVKSGNFKLVVLIDDKIVKEIPNDAFAETYVFENVTDTLSIRAAGESANVEFLAYIWQ